MFALFVSDFVFWVSRTKSGGARCSITSWNVPPEIATIATRIRVCAESNLDSNSNPRRYFNPRHTVRGDVSGGNPSNSPASRRLSEIRPSAIMLPILARPMKTPIRQYNP
ncbi:MAG: hypothetical protein WC082_07975 [Victivallales bacterium]